MDLLNQKVTHTKFGAGTIVDQQDKTVTVAFRKDKKKFVYPEGFGTFLKLEDEKTENIMNAVISKKKDQEDQERTKVLSEIREKKDARPSTSAGSQPANKCNVAIKREKAEALGDDRRVTAGRVMSGAKKGTAMNFRGVSKGNLVMLTTRDAKTEEKDRYIYSVFLVQNHSDAEGESEGFLEAHPEYCIALSEEEAHQVKFWEFYYNDKKPEVVRMGSGQHRYLSDIQAAQVLQKMLQVVTSQDEKEQIQKIMDCFLEEKGMSLDGIKEPSGALTR